MLSIPILPKFRILAETPNPLFMKPSRFSVFLRGLSSGAFIAVSFAPTVVSATPYWWDGGAGNNDWADAGNWSDSAAPNASPTAVPSLGDAVALTTTGLTGPFNINLNGNRTIDSLTTANITTTTTLLGGTGTSTLTIGAGGINHSVGGGLVIGSATAGQEVNIALATSATTITSSSAGTNPAAIIINNGISNASGGTATLTLNGINQNSIINGAITNGTGTLNIIKSGTGVWTLNNTGNTYSGTTSVNQGTLRLTSAAAVATPANITVANGATLSLRVGGAGFSSADVDTYRSAVTFSAVGSFLGLDTANGNFTYSSNISGNYSLNKLGGNTLTLDGTNTYTGTTTVTEGGLAFNNLSAWNNNTINVGANGVLTGNAGGAALTSANLDTLRTAATYTAGGIFAVSTGNGDFVYGSNMAGATMRFQKSGTNTLFLTGTSTFAGGVNVANGILSVTEILNGGVASSLGASTNAATNLNLNGGRLRYTGEGNTTNRLFQLAGSSTIDSSGTGALIFSNTGTNGTGTGTANARTLTLTGYNKGENTIAGVLVNSGASPSLTSVTKFGSGKWILSGANTFTGDLRVNGGNLTLDYGVSDALSTGNVFTHLGTLEFKGKSTGVTTETVNNLTISDGINGLGRLVLNGNGGSGVNLTITTLNGNAGNSQRHDLIDISGNAGNSITVTALGTALGMTNGVLMGAGSARANIILRDKDGTYGFAALSSATSGTIQKLQLANQTVLAAGGVTMNGATTNYLINAAGTYTQAAATNAVFNTLTMDSTAGAITLDLGANAMPAAGAGAGKAVLFAGSNDITITGTSSGIGTSALWFHNYIDSGKALNLNASFGASNFMIVGGTGTTLYSGQGLSASFIQDGGLFRATANQTVTASMRVNDGGVFEIGADLNGAGAGDFTHAIGTAAGNILFNGDGGLSAFGADRVANFGGAGAEVTWGVNNFLTLNTNTDGDYTFKLSSALSNAMITIQNGINLNGKTRTVEVANGSAAIDATLSGALTGGLSGGLVKSGAGTLAVTGTSTYQGATRVEEGKLIVGGGGINSTTSVHVRNATLELGAANVINDTARITLQNGVLIGGGAAEQMGSLLIIGDNQLNLVGAGNAIRFANSSAEVWSSTLAILDWAGLSTGGGSDQVYFGTNSSGLTGSQLSKITFVNPTLDGQSYSGNFAAAILATGEIVAVIPEPSAASLALLAAAGCLVRRRRVA